MNLPQRKQHRLRNWDYGAPGWYFVTICTKDKRPLLSEVRGDDATFRTMLTPVGKMVEDSWNKLSQIAPHIHTDAVCIMPNHVHGIIVIEEHPIAQRRSLGELMHGFKSATTRRFNQIVPADQKNTLWQDSYYDEIIRNDAMLENARNYITGNPGKWLEDPMYIQ